MCRVCAEATVYLAHRLQPSARQYSIDAVVFSVIRTAVIHVIRTAAVPADALCPDGTKWENGSSEQKEIRAAFGGPVRQAPLCVLTGVCNDRRVSQAPLCVMTGV